jgi:hypothetical protein
LCVALVCSAVQAREWPAAPSEAGCILSRMTSAEINRLAREKTVGDPAPNAVVWLREIALQLAILNERNAKSDRPPK